MTDFNFENIKGFHVVHLNVSSLLAKGKFDMFKVQVMRSEAHLVCLTETWLSDRVSSTLVDIPGYNLVRLDRHGKAPEGEGLLLI